MQTFIPGKDAALEDSIAQFEQKLTQANFDIAQASWLNPVPHVWSVHIKDNECGLCFTNGKGATKKAALASALGEYFERLSTNYFFADFYLGQDIANSEFVHYPTEKWFPIPADNTLPEGILDDHLHAFYDPDNELTGDELIDLQSGNRERGICALPFVRQSTQQVTYIPMNIIGNLYVSNGMSAGNTRNEARVQALSEIFERHIKNKIIAEAISLPRIPEAKLAEYPHIVEAIKTLEDEGFPILCYDASLGGHYPVICVILFNPQNGTCFASFGAHPDFGVALERTVTELLQGRSLKDLDVFMPPSFNNDDVAEHVNLETHFIDSSGLISWDLFRQQPDYEFVAWDFSGTTEDEFATLMAIFNRINTEVYIADYDHLGVYACRILAIGMSEIYPPEDLLMANNNMAMDFRDAILNLPDSDWSAEEYLSLIEQFDDAGFDDFARVRELLGIATGNNNPWYTLRIGELKAMLALAGGDLETAQEWIEWTREFNASTFTAQRSRDYHCLATLVDFALSRDVDQFDEYAPAFIAMFGQESVETQWAIVQGETRFYGLFSVDEQFSQLPAHQALLQTYTKLQNAKRAAM